MFLQTVPLIYALVLTVVLGAAVAAVCVSHNHHHSPTRGFGI